jgi:hypothetical protein
MAISPLSDSATSRKRKFDKILSSWRKDFGLNSLWCHHGSIDEGFLTGESGPARHVVRT